MKDKKILQQSIRLVSESAEQELLTLEERVIELMGDTEAMKAYSSGCVSCVDEEEDKPYAVHEGVAIVELKGPLVARSSWMTKLMGATSYEDMRAILSQAITDPEVKHILIDADTPGGQVNGLGELTTLIEQYKTIKPIDTYVAGGLLSAGYWIGASTNNIYASDTSFIGSIGVVVTHTSYQGMLEKNGIQVTKIKSGENKQVGSSEKNLTDKEKAYLQGQVNDLFTLFKGHVMKHRPQVNSETFDGSEYVAGKALAMGLIDQVMSFDDVLTKITSQHESNGGSSVMKRKLSGEEIAAAIASGASTESVESDELETAAAAVESEEVSETSETEAEATGSENVSEETEADVEGLEASAEAEGAVETEAASGNSSVVEYLEAKAVEDAKTITALETEKAELQKQVTSFEAMIPGLKKIAAEAINKMQVAMGLSAIELEGMETAVLVAQYESSLEAFNKAFKVGGLTTKIIPETEEPAAETSQLDEARLDAVSIK